MICRNCSGMWLCAAKVIKDYPREKIVIVMKIGPWIEAGFKPFDLSREGIRQGLPPQFMFPIPGLYWTTCTVIFISQALQWISWKLRSNERSLPWNSDADPRLNHTITWRSLLSIWHKYTHALNTNKIDQNKNQLYSGQCYIKPLSRI